MIITRTANRISNWILEFVFDILLLNKSLKLLSVLCIFALLRLFWILNSQNNSQVFGVYDSHYNLQDKSEVSLSCFKTLDKISYEYTWNT